MNATVANIGSKFQVGAAACAIAGATVLVPGAVANASPAAPMPMAGLGSSLNTCDESDPDTCLSPLAAASAGGSSNVAGDPPFYSKYFAFGENPEVLPDNIAVFEYDLVAALNEPLRSAVEGWWYSVIPNGFTACVLGATYRLSPYGAMTLGLTKGCTGD